MTLHFSKKEIFIIVLAVILAAAMIFSGYYYYISPKKMDIETKTATLKSEQEVLTSLQQKQTKTSDLTVESIAVLQRKVPVKPQLEQLILDLEKVEIVSGSRIKNMSFAEADVPGAAPQTQAAQQQPADAKNKEENTDSNKESKEQTKDENTEQTNQQSDTNQKTTEQTNGQTETAQPANPAPYQPVPLPGGIKRLTVTLSVVSSDYYELEKFITALEELPRTVVVETVAFSGGEEVTDLTSENKKEISYNLTFSAFYMPALTDLQGKLPELVPPEPGNKTYPFSDNFPDIPQ